MIDLPEELQQRIAAYIDGELPPADAARLEVFLANTDPALADMLVGMLADKVQVRAVPRPKAPVDLSARIMESIERVSLLHDVEHLAAPRRPWWQSRGAIAAGIAVLLGGFSYFVYTSVILTDTHNPWKATPTASNTGGAAAGTQIASGPPVKVIEPREGADAVRDNEPAALLDGSNRSKLETQNDRGVFAAASPSLVPALPIPMTAPSIAPTSIPRVSTAILSEATGTSIAPGAVAATPPASPATNAVTPAEIIPNRELAVATPPSQPPIVGAPGAGGGGFGGGGAGGGFGGGGGGGGGFGGAPARGGAGGGGPGGAGGRASGGGADGLGGPLAAGGGRGGGFGGGGAGGAGGGRGGRGGGAGGGGAGRGAPATGAPGGSPPAAGGRAAVAATPAQVVDYSTDNAAKAAQVLAKNAGSTPLVITLQATDDRAYAKLANDLTTYAVSNAAAPQAGQARGPADQSKQASGIALNSNGVVVLDNNAEDFQNFNNSARQQRGRNQAQAYNDVAAQALNTVTPSVQQATARGGPYRVALRADQIEELSKNYRVTVMARGDDAYQFRAAGDQAPIGLEAKDRAALLEKAGLKQQAVKDTQQAGDTIDCVITMESPAASQK